LIWSSELHALEVGGFSRGDPYVDEFRKRARRFSRSHEFSMQSSATRRNTRCIRSDDISPRGITFCKKGANPRKNLFFNLEIRCSIRLGYGRTWRPQYCCAWQEIQWIVKALESWRVEAMKRADALTR